MKIVNIFPKTQSVEERIKLVAQIAHEANRTYCEVQGEYHIDPWYKAQDHIKRSAIDGVKFIMDNPDSTPEQAHNNWMKFKLNEGWTYAPGLRDTDKKTHPCLKEWNGLTLRERLKDSLFHNIVATFLGETE